MECEVRINIDFSKYKPLIIAILVLYFRYVLSYSEDSATQAFHIFAMACYFTPVLGAIIADSYLGKFL